MSCMRNLVLCLLWLSGLACKSQLAAHESATSTGGSAATSGPGTWSWYDKDGSQPGTTPTSGGVCLDGSPTGFAINLSPEPGSKLLIWLDGGGACWDATVFSCDTASGHVTHLSFGYSDFKEYLTDKSDINELSTATPFAWTKPLLSRGVFDRAAGTAQNPFANYNYVFVPYCSGDMHAGDNVDTQSTFRTPTGDTFFGSVNFDLVLAAVQPLVPAPPAIVVAGGSAGGFGAYFNYRKVRDAYPLSIPISVVSDSAFPLATGTPAADPTKFTADGQGFILGSSVAAGVASYEEDYWADAWGLATTLSGTGVTAVNQSGPARGPIYRQEDIYLAAVAKNPSDQFGVIIGNADVVIPSFVHIQGPLLTPNVAQAITAFTDHVVTPNSARVHLLEVTTATAPSPSASVAATNGAFLLPWNWHHGHLYDDVSLWGPPPGGCGVLSFLVNDMGIAP